MSARLAAGAKLAAGSITLLVLVAAMAGCSPLAPRQDPSKFYLLTATPAGQGRASPGASATVKVIGLGPIDFPDYLERNQMVTRVGANQVAISETDRWAEPLDSDFASVLMQDLASGASLGHIVAFPWYSGSAIDYQVRIHLTHFEANSDGSARLSARWTIEDYRRHKPLYSTESNLSEPAAGASPAAQAAALSRLVADLSRAIADALHRIETDPDSAENPA